MSKISCASWILLMCFAMNCGAMSVNLSKETASAGTATSELNHKMKRSVEDIDSLLNEIISDEEFVTSALHATDKDKVQNLPLLQYLLLRKPNAVRIMQEKRSLDYRPRLGRRSSDDSNEQPKPYDVFFTPRMGKRADYYSPRLGRSSYSELY